ncbi:WecB/TagA/CpsF family glycosyltransferase [Microbulbifer sp. ALW1]|uniref:WecB/TagA/CpsF family glycosyltransferase n=1 Tax=Microbulbifer sp. (strain ALW1) TaxID=1516059 RepID=UPI00135BC213|nr:WecB/TagA/CpsF family glycosyltransferase [Microbulbifer sp. ALW1]
MSQIRDSRYRHSSEAAIRPEFKILGKGVSRYFREGINFSFLNFASIGIVAKIPQVDRDQFYFGCDGGLLRQFCSIRNIQVQRASFDFTSLAHEVFSYCENNHKTIYLVGAQPEEMTSFTNKLKKRYRDLQICGFHHGYFPTKQKGSLLADIVNARADILVVGLGAGRQEQFLLDARSAGFKGFGITCGAFITQTANARGTHYYPQLINALKLRWLYRMVREPHTIRRYLVNYPVNICRFLLGKYRFTSD